MLKFLFRRLLSTLPVLLIVAVLVFLMLRLTPGDPAAVLAGDAASTEQIAQIRTNLGLDRSILEPLHRLKSDAGLKCGFVPLPFLFHFLVVRCVVFEIGRAHV